MIERVWMDPAVVTCSSAMLRSDSGETRNWLSQEQAEARRAIGTGGLATREVLLKAQAGIPRLLMEGL
jgi:hypothetical protein